MNVTQIKQELTRLDVKFKSNMKKSELQQLLGAERQRLQDGALKRVPRHEPYMEPVPTYMPRDVGWLQHLQQEGWAVTDIPVFNVNQVVDEFYSWFEQCSDNFQRTNLNTWSSENMPYTMHGIVKHYLGHAPFQWYTREMSLPIFEQIYKTKDLLCSYDGGCLMKPGLRSKSWLHVDISRNGYDLDTMACVQGAVNLLDNGPEDGGLVLLPRSHVVMKQYLVENPQDGYGWWRPDLSSPLLRNLPLIKVCARPGQILLWDSRLVHANVFPSGCQPRMALYVSMQPKSCATEKEIAKGIKLYEQGRQSNHWRYGPLFTATAKHPYVPGHTSFVKPKNPFYKAELNSLQRKMVGY